MCYCTHFTLTINLGREFLKKKLIMTFLLTFYYFTYFVTGIFLEKKR